MSTTEEVFRLFEQSRHRRSTHERRSSSFIGFGRDFRVEGPAVTSWFESLTYEFVRRDSIESIRSGIAQGDDASAGERSWLGFRGDGVEGTFARSAWTSNRGGGVLSESSENALDAPDASRPVQDHNQQRVGRGAAENAIRKEITGRKTI